MIFVMFYSNLTIKYMKQNVNRKMISGIIHRNFSHDDKNSIVTILMSIVLND